MGGGETIWVKVTGLCFTNSKSKSNNYVKKNTSAFFKLKHCI